MPLSLSEWRDLCSRISDSILLSTGEMQHLCAGDKERESAKVTFSYN